MHPSFSSIEEYLRWFHDRDEFGKTLGGRIVSLTDSECIYEYRVSSSHFNPNGILHGGALFGAMDSSQGCLVHHVLDPKFKAAATGTATIRYSAPVREGLIRIKTKIKASEGRKIFVSSVATDPAGVEVASLEEIWITLKSD